MGRRSPSSGSSSSSSSSSSESSVDSAGDAAPSPVMAAQSQDTMRSEIVRAAGKKRARDSADGDDEELG